MSGKELIRTELLSAEKVLQNFLNDPLELNKIDMVADRLVKAFTHKNKLFTCGNGGSMCDAIHFAEELTGRYRNNRPALPAIAISDSGHISCVANDFGYENVFSRYVEGLAIPGDILFVISSSGNSKNLVNAVESAYERGMVVISLTGKDGGKLKSTSDINLNIPYNGFADRIQEMHIKIIHILVYLVEVKMGFKS